MINISICIPTKNFGEFIGQTLQSIVSQAVDGLEVVIVDGGSTDNTPEVVEKYGRMFPRLRYIRHDRAMGVDKDLATAIEMASGDYCWLLSADDVLKPGAVSRMIGEIEHGCDTYLFNRTECDRNLKPLYHKFWLNQEVGDCIVHFSNRQEVLQYFNSSISLGALFSYISSIVFSRKTWCKTQASGNGAGTNYQHAFRLFSMLGQVGTHKYIREALVFCRGQNDSFLEVGDLGIVRRFLIDIDGYHLLGEQAFADIELRNSFMRVMLREHHWFMWIRLAIRVKDDNEWKSIRVKLMEFGYSSYQLGALSILRNIEFILPMFKLLRNIRLNFKSVER